jgi:hypothetical protein
MHPNIIPSVTALRVLSVGHDTTYADTLWIQLIQFIAYNIGNGKYLDFTHTILTRIQELHPRFARAYEIDLLFLPTVSPENDDSWSEKKRQILRDGLAYYDRLLPRLCDMTRVSQIDAMAFGSELWSRKDLHNPCLSAETLYYMAARYDTDILDKKKAARYYKIASMHDDAPSATRFLGILASGNSWEHRDAALRFVLLATSGYDKSPYLCQTLAEQLAGDLARPDEWTPAWLAHVEQAEKSLKSVPPNNDPLSLAWWSCYDSLERGVKQIYLWYITDRTRTLPEITTEQDLTDARIIDHLPTIQSQSGYTITRKYNIWQYIQRLY